MAKYGYLLLLLFFVFLFSHAYADVGGPNLSVFDLGYILVFFLVDGFFNFTVIFAFQKIFLKNFFSKLPITQISNALLAVTVLSFLCDGLAILLLAASSSFLPYSTQPYFYLIAAFLILAVGNYLLLRYCFKWTAKRAAVIALGLAIIANPSWVLMANFHFIVLLIIGAVAVAGAVVFIGLYVERQRSAAEQKNVARVKSLAIIRNWVIGFIIFVAIVAFYWVLFFPPSRGGYCVCNSSDPTKILLRQYNITAASTDEVILQNATGGEITGFGSTATATGGFSTSGLKINGNTPYPAGADLLPGGKITITPAYGSLVGSVRGGNVPFSGSYTFNYADQFGYEKTVTITCQGSVPTI